ncbi:Uncharacterized protein GBIM_15912 [Gryllus bimaculatus]|nr:Uncharacterized protein GBIM_15912 [Gryllus bimaculatus]
MVYQITVEPGKDNNEPRESLYDAITPLKELAINENTTNLMVAHSNAQRSLELRKTIECIFLNTNIDIQLCTSQRQPVPNKRELKKKAPKQPSTGFVVTCEGIEMTYAELLKDIKNKLQVAGGLDKVNSVRKTKAGDLVLSLKEGEMEVKSIITKQLERTNARIVDHRRTILYVKHLDAITTAEELQERLRAEAGNEDVTVRSMRPAYGETQSATVEAYEETAEHLCKIGRINVGMVYCFVSRRLDVRRCHLYWSYGHIATNCRGEDRRNKCYNCEHEGHMHARTQLIVLFAMKTTGQALVPAGHSVKLLDRQETLNHD